MGPLKNIRVLDLTSVLMGPFATTILGDLGADIIKLESIQGDVMRKVGPSRSGEMGGLFLHANRSKRSIAVDLKTKDGLEVALKLAETVDVVFYNIRPKAMARLGLSYEDIKARKPDILYVGAFGYGQDGRYSDDPAYDDLVQGLTAIPTLIQNSTGGEPRYVPVNIADRLVGLYAGNAILAGLLHRNATGKGQKIDVPMFETMASVVLGDHLGGRTFVPPMDRGGYGRLLSSSRAPFKTSDSYLCLLLYTSKNRNDFADLLDGMTETTLCGMSRKEASMLIRNSASVNPVNAVLSKILPTHSTAKWLQLLSDTDIPHKPLHTIESLVADPHLADVGFFTKVEHPSEGPTLSMKAPADWSLSTPETPRPAPGLGQHSHEILQEIGLDENAIESLVQSGAVATSND